MQGDDKKYQKGIQLLKAESYDSALKIFNELVEKYPTQADYWSERGVIHFHKGNQKESLRDMDKAVELEPQKSYRYSSRAYILGHFKKTKAAIADYEKAIELDPEDSIAYNNLGLLEEQLGYQEKAQRRFKLADELDKALKIDGRTENEKMDGQAIEARNIQKEIDHEKENQTLWGELKQLGNKEGRKSFLRFLKSGFKET